MAASRDAGIDMTTQEGCHEFMEAFNSKIATLFPLPPQPVERHEPPDSYRDFDQTNLDQPKRPSLDLRTNYASPEQRRRAKKQRQRKLLAHLRKRG